MEPENSTARPLIRTLSPDEKMLLTPDAVDHYFDAGQSALDCILLALQAARKPVQQVKRVLDLPCGHGRVMRYVRAEFPEAEITGCDLLKDGVDFCAETFSAIPVYSHQEPAQIPLDEKGFDLIWVGSLLTHLDRDLWVAFFKQFHRWLSPGGILVFSTHGRELYRNFAIGDIKVPYDRDVQFLGDYERTGFGYVENHATEGRYGVSLSSIPWVLEQLAPYSDFRLLFALERGWQNHQDVFACQFDPDWNVPEKAVSDSDYANHQRSEARNAAKQSGRRILARCKGLLRPAKRDRS